MKYEIISPSVVVDLLQNDSYKKFTGFRWEDICGEYNIMYPSS